MQDRLQDLHSMQKSFKDFNDHELHEIPIDIPDVDTSDAPAGLQTFNEHVEKIRNDMNSLKDQINRLSNGHRAILLLTQTATQDEANRSLESSIEVSIRALGQELKSMSAAIKDTSEHNKWKTNIHSLLTKQFMEILTGYRTMESAYREKVKERIRQRVLVVRPQATAEELETTVQSGNLNIFAQELSNQNHAQAKDALIFVEKRHEEISSIEKNVLELARIFNDMAVLIDQQGEFIDDIESNVGRSVISVQLANKELVSAMRKKSRKRWCLCASCGTCIVLTVVAVILLIIFGQAANWFK